MVASDGGLVCFFSEFLRFPYSPNRGPGRRGPGGPERVYEHKPILIKVFNPLTRELKVLPPGSLLNANRPKMVQFVMDRETKCYQMIVVGDNGGGIGAEIYNSATGAWSSSSSISDLQVVYRYQYQVVYWEGGGQGPWSEGKRLGPCPYALVGDRLFVLHLEVCNESFSRVGRGEGTRGHQDQRYCVSEYQGHVDSTGLNWLKLKVHGSGFELPPKLEFYHVRLHACNGFLLVLASKDESCGEHKQDLAWLYDMAVENWRKLPQMVFCEESFESEGIMCERRWDAVP